MKKYYYKDWDFESYYSCLGKEAREEFIKWLSEIRESYTHRSNSINYEYGTSYCNDLFRAGETMVYLYTNKKGVPFYVGKGSENRALSIYNRSDAFKEKLKETDSCRIFAIAFNVMENDALQIETLCINELIDRGWRLTNSNKVCISREKLDDLRGRYSEVIDTLNKIQSVNLDCLLDGIDYFNGIGEVVVSNKTSVRAINE